jgi:hypothetical protein
MHSLLLEAILEDIFSDLITRFPNQKDALSKAKSMGVKPKYFLWLSKILKNTSEPVEDIIPLLLSFDKKQQAISTKLGKQFADINVYKTAQELSNKLEELNKSKTEQISDNVIYSDGEWVVVFPRTTEESCQAGSNTTWCTARTQSQNLFLSYTARKDGVILFYILKMNGDARKNPKDKLSVGFVDNKPSFTGDFGGLSVDAANNGLHEQDFIQILGNERWNKMLSAMQRKNKELGGIHPARTELQNLATNPLALSDKLKTFKDKQALADFITEISKFPIAEESLPVLLAYRNELRDSYNSGHFVSNIFENNPEISEANINLLLDVFYELPRTAFKLKNITDTTIAKALKNNLYDNGLVISALESSKIGPVSLETIYKGHENNYYGEDILYDLFSNPSLPEHILDDALDNPNFKDREKRLILNSPNIKRTHVEKLIAIGASGSPDGYHILIGKGVPEDIKINLLAKQIPNSLATFDDETTDQLFSTNILTFIASHATNPNLVNWANDHLRRRASKPLSESFFFKY